MRVGEHKRFSFRTYSLRVSRPTKSSIRIYSENENQSLTHDNFKIIQASPSEQDLNIFRKPMYLKRKPQS